MQLHFSLKSHPKIRIQRSCSYAPINVKPAGGGGEGHGVGI